MTNPIFKSLCAVPALLLAGAAHADCYPPNPAITGPIAVQAQQAYSSCLAREAARQTSRREGEQSSPDQAGQPNSRPDLQNPDRENAQRQSAAKAPD